MPVIGAKLPVHFDMIAPVIRTDVYQAFRHHHRNYVKGITQTLYFYLYHVKALAKNLMTIGECAYNFSHNRYLIVLNNLICHTCSPFLTLKNFCGFRQYCTNIYTPLCPYLAQLSAAAYDNPFSSLIFSCI